MTLLITLATLCTAVSQSKYGASLRLNSRVTLYIFLSLPCLSKYPGLVALQVLQLHQLCFQRMPVRRGFKPVVIPQHLARRIQRTQWTQL